MVTVSRRKPRFAGAFWASSHPAFSARGQAQLSLCDLHIRLPHPPATPAECRRKNSSLLLGFALIALAALVLVIFLP
jgi:hypothetical protein